MRLPGFDEQNSITSNEAFHLEKLPERIAIVGGGYIAVEFAGIFNGFGAKVTPALSRRADPARLRRRSAPWAGDGARHARASICRLRAVVHRIEPAVTGWRLHFGDGATLEVDQVMYATGRRPNTADLGAGGRRASSSTHHGAVVVDAYSKTSQDNIYAIGDVTDRLNLTPVAIREGHRLRRHASSATGPGPWTMTAWPRPSSASRRSAPSA